MRVVPFSGDYSEAWDNFVTENPKSMVYHYSAWSNLLSDTFGYKQKGFLLLNGNDILGGLPLFEVKGLLGKRLSSAPFRDRGGLLMKEKTDPSLLFDEAGRLLQEGNYKYLLVKQGDPMFEGVFEEKGFKKSASWITTVVDLTKGKSLLWNQLKNNVQGKVKQAEKYGLTIYAGESCEDMDTFYNIFFQTRKALGIPSFPRSFFEKMWYAMCLTGKAKLFLAKKDGLALAGVILFSHSHSVIETYAASLSKFRHLRANDLLIWKSLEWSIEQGHCLFDFGADSAKQQSLLAFKKKWTGIHKPMEHYFLLNKCRKINTMDSSAGKYNFIRKGFSRLPSHLFSWISNRVISYFG